MGSELNRVMQKYSVPNQGMAQTLGAMGRYGDSLVAHITPEEAMMLKSRGGAGTINPRTGLLEFYDGDTVRELIMWANVYKQYDTKLKRGLDLVVIGRKEGENIVAEKVKPYATWKKEKGLI
jgi:hypothetical protein